MQIRATHADHHRLAVHRLLAALEVLHDVAGDQREALLRADNRFELGPLRLQLLAAFDLFAFGHFLEADIDRRPLGLVEGELRQPALVVDWHRRPVFDRALDVVDADVVAEHGASAGVGQLDGCPGKADERGVGQRVPHVAGVAVDEVVLAAVRLVGDHHHIAPAG